MPYYRLVILIVLVLAACESKQKRGNTYRAEGGEERPLVDNKYSLRSDRKSMEDLRADVPEEKKRENDELAFILNLMTEVKRSPYEIREQFDKALRKKREVFDKDMTKEREVFTKNERKTRENFLKEQKETRDSFMSSKPAKEERTSFFKEQDEKRTDFFANERERRGDFESDVRERRKSFEDYARERQQFFNQEHRAYTKKYDDMKKQQRSDEAARLEKALQDARTQPVTPLESGQ